MIRIGNIVGHYRKHPFDLALTVITIVWIVVIVSLAILAKQELSEGVTNCLQLGACKP